MAGSGLEIERKYLLKAAPPEEALLAHAAVPAELEQIYLVRTAGDPRRIRRIVTGGSTAYVLTEKRSLGGITRREIERDLDAATFALLATEADPTRRPVRKTRWTWAEAGQTWELDVFHDPGDLVLLEVELSDANTVVTPPAWLDVVRDVSTDEAYFNWSLASIEASDEEPR